MLALQFAVVPPYRPAQFQVQGPTPLTAVAFPALQRFVVGALVNVPPFELPQAPLIGFWVNAAVTVHAPVICPVVYVLPLSDPLQPETVSIEYPEFGVTVKVVVLP